MFIFWLIISLLTLIALAFIIKPLVFYKNVSNKFLQENLEVEPNHLTVLILLFLLPIFSIAMYLYWGYSQQISQLMMTKNRAEEVKQEIAKFGSRQKIIVALRDKLLQLPKDEKNAKGWYLLGKLYFNEKNYVDAISAFQTAVALKSDEPEYILQLVSAKFFVNHSLTPEDEQLLKNILVRSPNNTNAVNLLALNAYQQKNFSVAIRYWESLLKYFPTDSEDSKVLLEMIRQAQNQLSLHPGIEMNVVVEISPALKNKINPEDSLFVYALESNGSKIPLAAVKQNSFNFPVHVRLDESNSMMPGRSLANAEKIYIEARISRSGNALPQKGDLVGKSEVISKQNIKKSLHIRIENVFP